MTIYSSKYLKQKLTRVQELNNKSTILVVVFNKLLLVTDR